MANRDLAVIVLTCLGHMSGKHVPLLGDRRFCWLPQLGCSTSPLPLRFYGMAGGLSFSLPAGRPTGSQARLLRLHVQLRGLNPTPRMIQWLLGGRRDLYLLFVHSESLQQRRRDTQKDTRGLGCIAPSAAPTLRVTPAWLPGSPASSSIREFLQRPVCSVGWPTLPLPEIGKRSRFLGGNVPCCSSPKLSLQTSFLSVLSDPGEFARSSRSSSLTTHAATTAAGLQLRDQGFRSRFLPKVSARGSACLAPSLVRNRNLRTQACFPSTLHASVGGNPNVNFLPGTGFSAPAECVDLHEDEEESQDKRGGPEEYRSKGNRDDFETTVSDDVLRDMVRRHFLYDEEEEQTMRTAAPFVVDGPRFNGSSPFACPPWGTMERMLPYSRSLASVPPAEDADAAVPPSARLRGRTDVKGVQDFWNSLAEHTTNWDFYVEPGSRVQTMANNAVLVTPPITPNRVFLWTEHDIERGAYEDPYAGGTVRHVEPGYLNPAAPALRTGRRRDVHRRTDTGKKQKARWGMENIQGDIPRGNWTSTQDIYKDMLDSVDWEREWPHIHDKNYYKRSHYSTLTGDIDRNEDSYWDPQFIGAVDTYPRVLPAGMNFTWPVYWVPWLCKKHPRRGGQPLKSEPFNLGGVEPLQLWFYPDGCELSHPGFCSVKLVSRPGWNLPFRIKMWIQGSTVDIPVGCESSTVSRDGSAALRSHEGRHHPGTSEKAHVVWGGDGRTAAAGGVRNTQINRSFISRVELGPVRREEADYVAYSTSFCRLLDKKSALRLRSFPFPPFADAHPPLPLCYNPATDVVLGAAGDVDIGVAVAEENWEWDDGHWSVEQWLKLQSAYPDDLELEETLPAGFTNSDMFENYKYRDVPDKHYAKYLPSALPPVLKGEDFDQMALNRRHAY